MFTGIIESIGRIARIESIGGDRRMRFESTDGYLRGIGLGQHRLQRHLPDRGQAVRPRLRRRSVRRNAGRDDVRAMG